MVRRVEGSIAGASLGIAEVRLLLELLDNPAIGSELAARLAIDSGQFSRLVRKLEEKGLIRREARERGRSLLRLTSQGVDQTIRLNNDRENAARSELDAMTEGERQKFFRSAEALGTNLDHRILEIEYRDGRPADTGTIITKMVKSLSDRPPGFDANELAVLLHRQFDKSLTRSSPTIVSEVVGDLAGIVTLDLDRDQNIGMIECLFVGHQYAGMGIGTGLVERAMHLAQEMGMHQVAIELPFPDERKFLARQNWTQTKTAEPTFCKVRTRIERWQTML